MHEAEVTKLKAKQEDSMKLVAQLQLSLSKLVSEAKQKDEQAIQQSHTISRLEHSLKSLELECSNLQAKSTQLEAQCVSKLEAQRLQAALDFSQAQNKELNQSNQRLRDENNRCNRELSQCRAAGEQMQKDYDALKKAFSLMT